MGYVDPHPHQPPQPKRHQRSTISDYQADLAEFIIYATIFIVGIVFFVVYHGMDERTRELFWRCCIP